MQNKLQIDRDTWVMLFVAGINLFINKLSLAELSSYLDTVESESGQNLNFIKNPSLVYDENSNEDLLDKDFIHPADLDNSEYCLNQGDTTFVDDLYVQFKNFLSCNAVGDRPRVFVLPPGRSSRVSFTDKIAKDRLSIPVQSR